MLTNRPLRVLLSALIVLGLHVCCCQFALVRVSHPGGSEARAGGCCEDHEETDDTRRQDVPRHDCCGSHASPVAVGSGEIRIPSANVVALTPVRRVDVVAVATRVRLGVVGGLRGAPGVETSLLRRHCALIV